MLRELSVQNLALIEDACIEMQPGYCAWTGETGAGKSLLLTGLGLVLGEKASSDLIRAGKQEARAGAIFDLIDSTLRADVEEVLGGPLEEDLLIISRRVTSQGRGIAHVNGMPVPIATLRKLGDLLINVHGQSEARDLMLPERQRELLDRHARLGSVLERFRHARQQHQAIRQRWRDLRENHDRRTRERELLAFEQAELATLSPRVGEYEELIREARRLANAEEFRESTAAGYMQLYEADGSIQDQLAQLAHRLEPLSEAAPELSEAVSSLERMAEEASEIARTLRHFNKIWDDDPSRLSEVEERLAQYRRLAARFHCTADDLEARQARVEQELTAIERDDHDLKTLDQPLALAWDHVMAVAAELSQARQKAARAFAKAVQRHLRDLNLGESKLSVSVETAALDGEPTQPTPPEHGLDRVEIMFAPNPGEEPRPLRKIASGGELSRLTLAVKSVLAGADRVPTLVFDEIDTGVGGRLGSVLGKKLKELAKHHQVLCVTHLPQMASHAEHQWVIRKEVENRRTRTTITRLSDPGRVEELAAMLRGDSVAEGTRREAQDMLAEARERG